MAGKLTVPRKDLFKKKSNVNYKYFLWAAIGLVILVVITPLLTHRRSDKAPSEKVTPETGVVMKEIPRSAPSGPDTGQPLQGTDSAAGIKEASLQPGSTVGQDAQPEVQVNQPPAHADSPSGGTGAIPAEPPPSQTQTSALAEPQPQPAASPTVPGSAASQQPKDLTAKQETAAAVPQVAPPQGSTAPVQQASVASQPQPPKPSEKPTIGGTTKYIVQIGSFSQKKNAESIQQTLLKSGYEVIVRTTDHAKFGRLYVVQLAPVYDPNKAESLLAKIRKEANVNPMMVKIPAGQ